MSWNWLEFSFNIIEHWWDYLISLLSLTVVHYVLPSSPVRELESSREQLKWILERKNNEKEIIAVYENFLSFRLFLLQFYFYMNFWVGFFCQGGALSWMWGWLSFWVFYVKTALNCFFSIFFNITEAEESAQLDRNYKNVQP